MIACFLSNICAKYYENPSMLSRVIAKNVGDVFFWDTVYIVLKYCKKIKRSIYSHLAHHESPPSNHERWTRGTRTQLEFTARDYEFTSSRHEWNAFSPLVNSWSRVHEFNGTQHNYVQLYKMMSISRDFYVHRCSDSQHWWNIVKISQFSGTDFWSPSMSVPVGTEY